MRQKIEEILSKISTLQSELEEEYKKARQEMEAKKIRLAENFLSQQRRYKVGLFRFILRSRFLVILTSPIIYFGWIPFIFMDLFVTIYQYICFPVYRIPIVNRSKYFSFDRGDLPYLNIIEKFNCFYCSYGNAVAAYTREIAGRTEQYWCPIKHTRRIEGAHDYYPNFFEYGDGQAYHSGLARLRRQYKRTPKSSSK